MSRSARAATGLVVAALVLLAPREAHLSGSSTVGSTAKRFRVEIESVRKIFRGGEGEAEWHNEWKRENQPRVDKLRAELEGKLDQAASEHKWPLIDYKAEYDEVLHYLAEEEDSQDVLKSGKPFRYRFQLRRADVIVCFAKLPPKALRAAMFTALEGMLPK